MAESGAAEPGDKPGLNVRTAYENNVRRRALVKRDESLDGGANNVLHLQQRAKAQGWRLSPAAMKEADDGTRMAHHHREHTRRAQCEAPDGKGPR